MKRPRSRPDRVGDALRHVLQRIDPERRLELFRMWAAEVGPAIAARSEPAGFRDGVLSVRVNGAAWMQELQFVKEEIRARLNVRLGGEVVRDVYFVSGGGGDATPAARAVAKPAPPPDEPDEPIVLPNLRDPRLAEVFARIARAHRRRRQPS
jgi:predicted nucleic acid-binding Zn ribbon protein